MSLWLASPDTTPWRVYADTDGTLVTTSDVAPAVGVTVLDSLVLVDVNSVAWELEVGDDGALQTTTPAVGTPTSGLVVDGGWVVTVDIDGTLLSSTTFPVFVEVLNDLPVTPGLLSVTISNAPPNAECVFSVEDEGSLTDYFTATADSTGTLTGVSVPVPIELAAGAYTLLVNAGGMLGEDTFIVLTAPEVRPTPPGTDTLPSDPELVNVWAIIDPADYSEGRVWTFPYNPTSMSSPHGPKAYDFETTTAPNGAVLTWEGAPEPVAWSVSGYLDTQATYEAFENYVDSNRRYVVVDHRQRAWVVIFEEFDPQYHKSFGNDWSFDYEVKMLILQGPVTL